jgi:hypothetical protein
LDFIMAFLYMPTMYFDHILNPSPSLSPFLLPAGPPLHPPICVHVHSSFRSSFSIWEKTWRICLSEFGLSHSAWWSPVLFIFL